MKQGDIVFIWGATGGLVRDNRHEGKIGVRCLAPRDGLGVTDPAFREQVGEDRITLFRRHGRPVGP